MPKKSTVEPAVLVGGIALHFSQGFAKIGACAESGGVGTVLAVGYARKSPRSVDWIARPCNLSAHVEFQRTLRPRDPRAGHHQRGGGLPHLPDVCGPVSGEFPGLGARFR